MDEATIALTAMTGSLLAVFLGLFIWGLKTGQFRNTEEAKYIVFRGGRKPDGTKKSRDDNPEGGGEA